jgi:hypothetical protein
MSNSEIVKDCDKIICVTSSDPHQKKAWMPKRRNTVMAVIVGKLKRENSEIFKFYL